MFLLGGWVLGFPLSLSLNLKDLLIVTAWTLLRTGLDLLKQLGRRVSGVSGLGSLEPEKCDPIDDFTIFYYWLWPNHEVPDSNTQEKRLEAYCWRRLTSQLRF
jgi:hypothetical protein